MCSTPSIAIPTASSGGGIGPMSAVSSISASIVKAKPEQFITINILEADEAVSVELPAGTPNVPLGKLLNAAYDRKLGDFPWFKADKTLVLLCNEGKRAEVAARELSANGYNASFVTRGLLEWGKPAATKPEFVVVLQSCDSEQVTLALTAAKVNQEEGRQTVLVGMADGVMPFRDAAKTGCPATETIPDMQGPPPLPPTAKLWCAFKAAGGVTLTCTTCGKVRGLEPEHMLAGAVAFGMPDLIRMQKEAAGNLTFAGYGPPKIPDQAA